MSISGNGLTMLVEDRYDDAPRGTARATRLLVMGAAIRGVGMGYMGSLVALAFALVSGWWRRGAVGCPRRP